MNPILKHSLLVSCQATRNSPLDHPDTIARIAHAAVNGGASGLRINGPSHIAAVRRRLPTTTIIGLHKVETPGTEIRITPTATLAEQLVVAGCDIVAIDATERSREGLPEFSQLVADVHSLGVPVLADIDTVHSAQRAEGLGADFVATTLAGYTEARALTPGPDLELVSELRRSIACPVIAEGRYAEDEQVAAALDSGAHAVVVGTAITDPMFLTRQLADSLRWCGDAPSQDDNG
jgi:N-acylglucosamine-6-phosphate 2-epimerase